VHTLDTAVVAMRWAFCEIGASAGTATGTSVLLALYHDCGEILTGECRRRSNILTGDQPGYKTVESSPHTALRKMPAEIFRPTICLCSIIPARTRNCSVSSRRPTKSPHYKMLEEENAGNREFSRAKISIGKAIADMHLPKRTLLWRVLPSYGLTLDELD
jgi:hypothetical protein